MKDAKTFWDNYAPRYARSRIQNPGNYQKKLEVSRSYLTPDSRVLEVGCGTGSTALEHAAHVGSILATDISAEMIAIAEQKLRDSPFNNVEFQCGTLQSLSLQPQYYDAILALNVLHLLDDVPAALHTMYQLLKPGGVLISSTALVGEAGWLARTLVRLLQRVNMAPYVSVMTADELISQLQQHGFHTQYEWFTEPSHVFLVSQKL